MAGGVKGTQWAAYWFVTCPRCKAAPYRQCVRVDGSGVELRSRHEARAMLGRITRRRV
jgi:hypothetical protein